MDFKLKTNKELNNMNPSQLSDYELQIYKHIDDLLSEDLEDKTMTVNEKKVLRIFDKLIGVKSRQNKKFLSM